VGKLLLISWFCVLAFAQDPFVAAKDHYRLEFENDWVQVSRVSYGPHETAPVHDHPAVPTVYVYMTDGGPIRFSHDKIGVIERPAVKAGQIRFARPNIERHEVEYLGDAPCEYLRIQLKTEPLDIPARDIRLAPAPHANKVEFENAQLRILREYCAPDQACAGQASPNPAVLVSLESRRVQWVEPGKSASAPGDSIRIELVSKPR
jgi:quercetin dioxygenase-like cupin family protein